MIELPLDKLPFVVGVTGHRDIAPEHEAPLRKAFNRILDGLAKRCPNTPLLVLSGLAAGADSLAAEEAIARNIPVVACLPMPVDEYEKDFSNDSLRRFRELLAACSRVNVASSARDGGYVAAGRFIGQYSHLLVAFWDGGPGHGPGGTADVIAARLRRPVPGVEAPYLPDVGPVDVVATPRANGPLPAAAYTVKRSYPRRFADSRQATQSFETILSRIDAFNADIARGGSGETAPPLAAMMMRADAAANSLQRQTNNFQMLLFVIAYAAGAIQVIAHVPPLAKVLGLIAALLAYRAARKHDYENRYQDYRAIAEGLRVQDAWSAAGLEHRLVDNEYLRMQDGELQWIRMALRSFHLLYCEGFEAHHASYTHPTCRAWIRSQWRYYYRAARRESRLRVRLSRIGVVALAAGILWLVVSAAVLGTWLPCALAARLCSPNETPPSSFDFLQSFLTVPIVLAAMLGAIFTHYSEKTNLAGSARRYERMFYIFDRARRDLAAIEKGGRGNPQQLVYELGKAALIEHADWLIMRRDRPMKVVMV